MTVEEFLQIKNIDKLSEQRQKIFHTAEKLNTALFNDKYWDLLGLINTQWYYITTIKKNI